MNHGAAVQTELFLPSMVVESQLIIFHKFHKPWQHCSQKIKLFRRWQSLKNLASMRHRIYRLKLKIYKMNTFRSPMHCGSTRDGSISNFQPIPIFEFLCQLILIPILEFPKKKLQFDLSGTFTSHVHKLHKLLSELSAQKTPKQHFSLIFPVIDCFPFIEI